MINSILLYWYSFTIILVTSLTSLILHNNYNTNMCYDGLYTSISMYELLKVHLIIYSIVALYQLISISLIFLNRINSKHYILFLINILMFIMLCMLNGLYINFILTNKDDCLHNFKTNDIYVYIYFITSFAIINITALFIILNIICIKYFN